MMRRSYTEAHFLRRKWRRPQELPIDDYCTLRLRLLRVLTHPLLGGITLWPLLSTRLPSFKYQASAMFLPFEPSHNY